MPVSSPSYFPPNRGNGSIVGITAGKHSTGARCFLGGANAGNNSSASDIVILGDEAAAGELTAANHMSGAVVIGSAALQNGTNVNAPNFDSIVVIGFQALQNADGALGDSVWIGHLAGSGVATASGDTGNGSNVVIGCETVNNPTFGSNVLNDNVIIGAFAVGASTCRFNVIIGSSTVPTICSNSILTSVIIGHGIDQAGNNPQYLNDVIIGENIAPNGHTQRIIIGASAGTDTAFDVNVNNLFYMGIGGVGSVFYGDIKKGNIIVGGSTAAQRNVVNVPGLAVNTLGIPNGAKGSTAVGGGYLYAIAGALHWVGSTGTDTLIAPA